MEVEERKCEVSTNGISSVVQRIEHLTCEKVWWSNRVLQVCGRESVSWSELKTTMIKFVKVGLTSVLWRETREKIPSPDMF